MSKYDIDISEVSAFIFAALSDSSNDYEECLARLSSPIGESYLDERGQAFVGAVQDDGKSQFSVAIRKLSSICNKNKKQCEDCPVKKYCNTYIKNIRETASHNGVQMVDLFCGAGGLSLGFTQEGFVTALANDIEPCCVDTYAHNHPETPRDHIILGDIREVVGNLSQLLADRTVDIVVGGPPCQGFSMANRQRLIDDPRNYLYKNYVEAVNTIQPAFFVMENVKGMLSVAEQVKEDFRNIGYTVECHILNAKDYGVPQNRERLIYIGNRLGIDNEAVFSEIFELAKLIPNHVLKDALYGLRPLQASRTKNSTEDGSEESGYRIEKDYLCQSNEYIDYINQGKQTGIVCNHKARYNNDRDIEIFGRMNQGDRSDDPKIADIMPYARRNDIFKDKYFKLEETKVCKTITAHMKFDCNMYIHPTQARGLTPREAARVQSYPDDYYFRGAYTKTYMQIGNSVPPLLGRAIAQVIKKYLKGAKE